MDSQHDLPDELQMSNSDVAYVMYRGIPIPLRKSEVEQWEDLSRTDKNTQWRKVKALIKSGAFVVIQDDAGNQICITKTHYDWLQKLDGNDGPVTEADMIEISEAIKAGVKSREEESRRPKVIAMDGAVLDKKTKKQRGIE